MALHLVADPESPFYQSPAFDKLLNFVQSYPRRCLFRETGKRRSLVIRHVESVEDAVAILDEVNTRKCSETEQSL